MARVVLACWGSYGDLFPYLGIGRELKRRGHEAVIATCERYRPEVEAEGLAHHAVRPDQDPADLALLVRALHPRFGARVLLREILAPHVEASFADTQPAVAAADLVVAHPLAFAAPMAAQLRGIPWVGTVLAPASILSAFDPPELPTPALSRLVRRLGPPGARLLFRLLRGASRGWVRPVTDLRVRLGLPALDHVLFDGQFSPHGTLALFPRMLATPQPDWPAGIERTGAVDYNGAGQLPEEVARFLDAGPPPVVFTLGSTAVHVAGGFYAESAAAATSLGQRALLLVGRDQAPPTGLPPTHLAAGFAPHRDVFPRAAAIVHPAGIGTTTQALRSGRPQLIVPFAYDQPDNAARVSRLGTACVCPIRRYRADRVARDLNRLLHQASYQQAARVAAKAMSEEDGAGEACDLLERILLQRTRRDSR